MKKLVALMAVALACASVVFAANQLTGVAAGVAQKNLDSFAKDIGSLIGSSNYHQGQNLGFPGFDVGLHVTAKGVDSNNRIVKTSGVGYIMFPSAQVEIGLPAKVDLLARFMSYGGSNLVGYGLRYGLYKSELPVVPSLSVQFMQNNLNVSVNANKFSASALSAAAVLSMDLVVVSPYLGVNFTQTGVTPDSTITNLSGSDSGYRLEGGVNLSLIPLTYVQVGGTYIDGDLGYNLGFGLKF